MEIETEVVVQRTLFDYAALSVENSVIVQQRTSEIKSLVKRVASDIVEIGGKLADVRARLKDGKGGKFKDWLETEFPEWSQRTAYNYLTVWEKFGSADFAVDGIAPSALYLLSAPSTPEASREMAKQLVQSGYKVSHSVAEELVRQTKPKKLKQAELIEELDDLDRGEDEPPPIEVYIERSELDGMDRINACQKIGEGKPVEFYDYEGEPVIITGSVSSGAEGMISVEGWRIVPENDAKGVTPPERGEFETQSYIGTPVNVGTKKRPDWWVIVGPQYEFKRKPREEAQKSWALGIGQSAAPVVNSLPTPGSAQKRSAPEMASAEFFPRPEGWFDTEIEIRIRLLPGDGAKMRKIRYEVRADESNDGEPFTSEDYDEEMLLRLLPDGAYKLVERVAEAFVPGSALTKDPKELRREALARYRSVPVETVVLEDEEDYQAKWLAGLSKEEREKYDSAPCRCGHARYIHDGDDCAGKCTALNCGKTSPVEGCSSYHCPICNTKGGHQANCTHYILGEGTPVQSEELKGTAWAEEEKPGPMELPQAEINRIAALNNCGRLGENKPLKLAYINGQPFLVTGAMGSGDAKNYQRVWAWVVKPLSDVGDENARDYQDAYREYSDRLQRSIKDRAVTYQPLSYQNVKIKVGTEKKFAWWVMCGPEVTFTSEDDIEAEPEDVNPPQLFVPKLEEALEHALLHHVQNAAKRWKLLQKNGATDAELLARVADEFEGDGGSTANGGWKVKGGKSPQFTWKRDGSTLKGKRLLAKVREVLQIGPPKPAETATVEVDDFTATRCEECKRIDGAHADTCSQRSNALTFEDYLAYARFTWPKSAELHAREWEVSREKDGEVAAWKLYWEELKGKGVNLSSDLCLCGHLKAKHDKHVGCLTLLDSGQSCQCVTFVASAKSEEPRRAKKGKAAK